MYSRWQTVKGYLHILLPTGMGVLVYVILTALTFVRYHFTSLQSYLYVPAHVDVEGWVLRGLQSGFDHLFGATRVNGIVLGLFWAIVGLFVLFFIRGLAKLFHEVGADLEERNYIRPKGSDANLSIKLFLERSAFRLVAVVLALIYLNHVLTPIIHGQGFVSGHIWTWIGTSTTAHYVAWFVFECLAWHGLTILLRLIALRQRLFG